MKMVWAVAFAVVCQIVAAESSAAAPFDQAKLAEIDRTFVCPESLPNFQAKEASLKQFISQVSALGPVTVSEMIDLRMRLLAKHSCTETLQRIHDKAPE
jgi:hypothetical protein